jgi:hypothetical protein
MLTLTSRNTANAKTFEWQIGDATLSGQTVNWPVPSAGTFEIIHTVAGVTSGDEAPQKNTAAPIGITAVDPELSAVAEVLHRGKPYSQSSNIYAGDTLQLVSKSSGPVLSATWTVNGEEISGNIVSWPIPAPGDIEICLKVQGQNPGQVDVSLPLKVFAKKRPPVWMLWAVGGFEFALLSLLAYFFSGNQLRESIVQVEGGQAELVKNHWSRLHKGAQIFVGDILPGEYWRNRDRKEAIVITPASVPSGPPGGLSCTFASAGGLGSASMDEDPTRRTPTELHYILIDERDNEQRQSINISLQILKPTLTDVLLLLLSAAVLTVIFITFLVKIYPTFH